MTQQCTFAYELANPSRFDAEATYVKHISCQTHNCDLVYDNEMCLVGRVQQLTDRVAVLEEMREAEIAGEIKRLRNDYSILKQDYDAKRAEVERLQYRDAYNVQHVYELQTDNEQLRAKNAELRTRWLRDRRGTRP